MIHARPLFSFRCATILAGRRASILAGRCATALFGRVRWGLLGCLVVLACGPRERGGIPPRNVVLITVDGLRADHLSCYRSGRPTGAPPAGAEPSSSIDDLAQAGVLFTSAFGLGGEPPAEGPGILTWRGEDLQRELGTEDGLECGLFGLEAFPAAWQPFDAGSSGSGPSGSESSASESSASGSSASGSPLASPSDDARTWAAALDWVRSRDWKDGRRRFLWVHAGGPAHFPDSSVDSDSGVVSDAQRIEGYERRVREWTERVSTLLRTLLPLAEEGPRWERTALAIVGVAGVTLSRRTDPWAERPWGRRSNHTEGAGRVPAILHHPPSLTGRRIFREPISAMDLPPTIRAWFGLPPDPDLAGRNLFDHVDSRPLGRFRSGPLIWSLPDGGVTVRDDRWRWIRRSDGSQTLIDAARHPPSRVDVSIDRLPIVDRLRRAAEERGRH